MSIKEPGLLTFQCVQDSLTGSPLLGGVYPVPTPRSPLREAEGSTLCQPPRLLLLKVVYPVLTPTFTPLKGDLPCANPYVHFS